MVQPLHAHGRRKLQGQGGLIVSGFLQRIDFDVNGKLGHNAIGVDLSWSQRRNILDVFNIQRISNIVGGTHTAPVRWIDPVVHVDNIVRLVGAAVGCPVVVVLFRVSHGAHHDFCWEFCSRSSIISVRGLKNRFEDPEESLVRLK